MAPPTPRRRIRKGERKLEDAIWSLDVLTSALNDAKGRDTGLEGALRWMVPKVTERRATLSRELAQLRNKP